MEDGGEDSSEDGTEETEDGTEETENGTEERVRKFCSSEVTKFSHSFLLPLRCCPLSAEHRIFCRRAFSESFFLSISPD